VSSIKAYSQQYECFLLSIVTLPQWPNPGTFSWSFQLVEKEIFYNMFVVYDPPLINFFNILEFETTGDSVLPTLRP
jgi:hypothetical protein